jgi:vacuolar iron transporter family protein
LPVSVPHHHHHETHSQSTLALRDIVVGVSDGLTVPFALAAGLSGAVSDNSIILLAGLAEIIAGTISMGLGGYLAGQTEIEHYEGEQRREEREVREIPREEEDEIKNILEAYGISAAVRQQVADDLARDHRKWVDFMMRFELGLEKPDPRQALHSAFRIGVSYALGGLAPLLGYFFLPTPRQGLFASTLITLACLVLFGYWKARLTGQDRLKGAVRMTLTGLAAAAAAFGLARLIRG